MAHLVAVSLLSLNSSTRALHSSCSSVSVICDSPFNPSSRGNCRTRRKPVAQRSAACHTLGHAEFLRSNLGALHTWLGPAILLGHHLMVTPFGLALSYEESSSPLDLARRQSPVRHDPLGRSRKTSHLREFAAGDRMLQLPVRFYPESGQLL